MKLKIQKASQRGRFQNNWLNARYSFSFAQYFNPEWLQFKSLRVLNHDQIQPNSGFDFHSHQDMEIITYVLKGEVLHKDSIGNTVIVKPGELQRMSAGTGITHSEVNPSQDNMLELLQIWFLPEKLSVPPSYESLNSKSLSDGLHKVVSSEPSEGELKIHQQVEIFIGKGVVNDQISLQADEGIYLYNIEGSLTVLENQTLSDCDGLAIEADKDESLNINLKSLQNTHFIAFKMR